MLIGIDFDNTIVSYENVFHRTAVKYGLIAEGVVTSKKEIRDYLRRNDREDEWIELQGMVYGKYMPGADIFEGFREFIGQCWELDIAVKIISHRTHFPYIGKKVDLHQAARNWLIHNSLIGNEAGQLPIGNVFFEVSLQDKLTRISKEGCTHFIDDLPELLSEPAFPDGVRRMLFDPLNVHTDDPLYRRYGNWTEICSTLLMETAF